MNSSIVYNSNDAGLRQRQRPASSAAHTEDLNASLLRDDQSQSSDISQDLDVDQKPNKTFGRTPDGTVFTVPTTHDMVSQLLDPRQPKNLSDLLVLAILALQIGAAYFIPASWKRPVFALVFLFWRAAYNIGIGYLLTIQSQHRRLETWAARWKLFEHPSSGKQPRPWLYNMLKRELEAKIPEDYSFEKAPMEYNTWLVFRRVVDLILMCDFVSYCLFAIICGHTPEGESLLLGAGRWIVGILLVLFNLWVKLDAHRVVKDYAWYWGDFFYLIDQELNFDGVFEMAPHPMYSIGYAGYYGISMMAASYEVLFISVVAHLAQFAFLVIVENPHIEKTYNPPVPRKRTVSTAVGEKSEIVAIKSSSDTEDVWVEQASTNKEGPPQVHNMLGLGNFDLFRITDTSVLLLGLYLVILTLVTPSTQVFQAIFLSHALLWRVWYHLGLGAILYGQSKNKFWTRHFLKFGETHTEAWNQWKGMYHLSLVMSTSSFLAACWKMYSPPEDWAYGWVLLKHVVGAGLVALQIWTSVSVYDSLGEFGWFFGDFFYDSTAKLTYKSIYRFLNNPERIFGTAGLWGLALITWSRAIFVMALISQILTLAFINFIEKPHMQKIYGRSVRQEAGLTKFIKRSLPPPVQGWQRGVDKVLDGTAQFIEEFLDTARPKFAAGIETIVRDTSALFNKYPARLTITRLSPDLAGLNPKCYSLTVEGTPSSLSAANERATGKESVTARFPRGVETQIFEYGAPLKVKWRAPAKHDSKDWIGLYMVTDNHSRDITEVSSLGRWVPTTPGNYDAATADKAILVPDRPVSKKDPSEADLVEGEVIFEGDRLWWTQGVFEFRFHHAGSHNVMNISQPFEIRIGKFDEEDVEVDANGIYERAVEEALLPVVQNCCDRDPDIAPNTVEESFGGHVERDGKYAKRIVYAIHQMFGIEFAPAIVPADGNVKKMAWRICNAKQVLAPYSMSASKGTSTPTGAPFEKA
ncbi:Phosphatidylethanolamine N-methyltransferase [Colletotrichum fructicola]|uniref:Phosphatidylethanolamine N-methyltransferase n=1 Tax=Colletotrichum fructicola (strain Nara gc5) TaxID=1213859 RepID=L2FLU0_COLFN|nr:Phosphatidylethanolamine [Colletotrichum fructicola]KAE9575990.1 Phosphatidylethanolamine [Colletotrichum fructicola]KAF4886498.1 Phosphatidylethanolamine N-methyltransferase [Colletotrichum fructicola]KAF4889720.1 Phosphatidylethanolamine N-methyltransferase [Colletotrichum fructicola]KAI8286248.1 Phosphatidylethanolamine [Colletotrichum sp. SAR11_57]